MNTTNQARDMRGRPLWVALAAVLTAGLAMTACEDNLAPQFEFEGTGDVEGLVFYDAVEDGVYDPASGDVPLSGVNISIQDRGTGQSYPGGTATSGANGRFTVTGLPAGTHDLFIDTLSVPEEVSICQNPLQVTVNIDETRFSEVRGRAGCLISIAEAKETDAGTFVIVRGIVTSFPNQIDPSYTYIQDETAGARIYSGALAGLGIEVGDQLEIGAFTADYQNDFNFEDVVFRNLVKDFGEIQPVLTTTAEISTSGSDWTDPLQGAFIRVEKAELTVAFGDEGNDGQNGTIDDGSGASTMRVNDGVAPEDDLNTLFTVGKCYNIAGFGANYAGSGQIFPRSLDDIQEVPCN